MAKKHVSGGPVVRVNRVAVDVLMAVNHVTRREVARAAGVHHVTVTKTLRNYRSVSAEKRMAVIRALAARLGRDPSELCLGRLAA